MIKNIFKNNYFLLLVIGIFNISLITKKIKFAVGSPLNICIIFLFFCISYFIIEIKRENKSILKLRIITVIIFLVVMLIPINIIPDKYSLSSGLIILTECIMLENMIYFFISNKTK